MKNREARELAQDFNDLVSRGRVLWEQASDLADRCNAIRAKLDEAGVAYDQIALLFGGELDIEVVGDDEADVNPMNR